MIAFFIMLKYNIKLLLRNPGFWISMILLPIAATFMFTLQYQDTSNLKSNSIVELSEDDLAIVDADYSKLIVLAYDNSHSSSSKYLLDELNYYGLYKIYLYNTDSYPDEFENWAKDYMNNNTAKVILYFPENFERNIIEGQNSGITLYEGNDDDRLKMLKEAVESSVASMDKFAQLSNKNNADYIKYLEDVSEHRVEKNSVDVVSAGEFDLSDEQKGFVNNIAFAIAILSFAFVLSGVFSSNIIIRERNNNVLTRVHLSTTSISTYTLVKVTIGFIVTILQTIIATVGILIFTNGDFGISTFDFVMFTATLGLIFNTVCIMCGLISNNLMNALYFSFGIWMITNMLSGVYFPSMELDGWIGKVSDFTPQKWVLKTSKMIMTNQENAYSKYIIASAVFFIVVLIAGLTISRIKESKSKK